MVVGLKREGEGGAHFWMRMVGMGLVGGGGIEVGGSCSAVGLRREGTSA
jgi:hypothetical protein